MTPPLNPSAPSAGESLAGASMVHLLSRPLLGGGVVIMPLPPARRMLEIFGGAILIGSTAAAVGAFYIIRQPCEWRAYPLANLVLAQWALGEVIFTTHGSSKFPFCATATFEWQHRTWWRQYLSQIHDSRNTRRRVVRRREVPICLARSLLFEG